MATQVFRVNPGENEYNVTQAVGGATTKMVELTVDLNLTGVGGTRQITRDEVLEAIEEIEGAIMRSPWPPA
jgi:uncharacterized protein YqgV (UPF0045/DUF77 family)